MCLQRINITIFLILLVGWVKCVALISFFIRVNGFELEATTMLWIIYGVNSIEKDPNCQVSEDLML